MKKENSLFTHKIIFKVCLFFLITVIIYAGIRVSVSANTDEVSSKTVSIKADAAMAEVPVFASEVALGTVSNIIKTSGEIHPIYGVNLNPEASGKITDLYVDVGSAVKKGEKLAQIDNKIQKAQFQEADSVVTVAKSAIKLQEVLIETSESRLVAAKASLDAAESALKNLSLTKARLEKLFQEGAVSRQSLDDVVAQFDAAGARFTGAESDMKLAADSIKTGRMTLEMRKAELIRAEANRNSAKVLLDNTVVIAPFDGVITARHADPGAMASVGQPIFRIEQDDPVKIICSLAEKDLSMIRNKDINIIINVDSHNKAFEGAIRQIYPTVDPVSRTGKVEVLVPNKDKMLMSGMFASINFVVETHENVPVVSRDSLLKYDGKFYVYVIEDGKAVRRQVGTGITQDTTVEILAGLKSGETIISKGIEFIREGSRVSVASGDNNL